MGPIVPFNYYESPSLKIFIYCERHPVSRSDRTGSSLKTGEDTVLGDVSFKKSGEVRYLIRLLVENHGQKFPKMHDLDHVFPISSGL